MSNVIRLPPPNSKLGNRGYALAYAAVGWRVFPVYEMTPEGVCSCSVGAECDRPGKHPRVPAGAKEATTDAKLIDLWWGRWPHANVGIATGKESNLTVIDADTSKGKPGVTNLTILTASHGGLPALGAFIVDTGGGGLHLYFSYTPELPTGVNVLAEAVDVRNDGGYVVAPYSIHASGKTYSWRGEQRGTIGPVPEWLRPGAKESERTVGERKRRGRPRTKPGYRLEKIEAMLAHIDPDDRDRWLKVGVILGRLYLGTALEPEAWALYEAWAARSDKFDIDRTANLSRMREMFHEKPNEDPRTGGRELSIGTLISWAKQGGWSPFGKRAVIPYEQGAEGATIESMVEALVGAEGNTFFNVMGEVRDVLRTAMPVPRMMMAAAERGEAAPETLVVRRTTTHGLLCAFTEVCVLTSTDKDGAPAAVPISERLATMALKQKAPMFPTLSGVAEWPMVAASGELIGREARGYDPVTGLYFAIAPGVVVNESLSAADAWRWMKEELFADFPFEADEDQAAALGLAVAMMQRPMMKTCPAWAIVAPQPGTGKSTLVEVLSLAIHGGPITSHAFSQDEEELRKAIHSLMLSKAPAVLFDNVGRGRSVDSDHLAKLLTSEVSADRTLGSSDTRKEVNTLLVTFTGNNIEFAHDMASRVVTVRLNAKMPNPLRRSFKHRDVKGWATAQRNPCLSALTAIVRAGLKAPELDGPASRFEEFDAWVVRPVLAVTGVDIRSRLDTSSNVDSEEDAEQRAALVLLWRWQRGWRKANNGHPWRVSEVTEAIDAKVFDDTALSVLQRACGDVRAWERDPGRALGRLLRLLNGDHKFAPVLLRSTFDAHAKVNQWFIHGTPPELEGDSAQNDIGGAGSAF